MSIRSVEAEYDPQLVDARRLVVAFVLLPVRLVVHCNLP